jgi:predicted nucleotidyltransferase
MAVAMHPASSLSPRYDPDMEERHMSLSSEGRPSAEVAGRAFIRSQFPDALVALVAGSFIRGEDTSTSDLDVMIVTNQADAPYRAAFRAFGWPIEAFVHTPESYRWYFQSDVERRIPSLAAMCSEGIVVTDTDGLAERMRTEARALLVAGPPPLTDLEREDLRYALTEALDDLLGTLDRAEGLFIAHQVAEASVALLLLINNRWIGRGKWMVRALRRFAGQEALRLDAALSTYYRSQDKTELVEFARDTLDRAGGPLFDGFFRSGQRNDPA